jgi:excisionase family DNA binding protein
MTPPNGLLTAAQVAEFLQVPVQTLYLWRHKGVGPKTVKVGRHLRYRQADIDAWVESLIRPLRSPSWRRR